MSPNKEQEKITRKTIVEKREYEKSFSKCKKLRTLIRSVVERNITFIKKILR